MVRIYHCFKKIEKSGIFCQFFYLFNCEQFLLKAFKKCLFLQKQYGFCIFHGLQLTKLPTYIIYVVKVGKKLAKSSTPYKSLQYFFPGKNRIRKIREKSGYEISYI